MTEWLLGLWEKNKLLFWLLIIPVALAFLVKIYQEIIFHGAKKSLEKADKKSDETKQKVAAQEAKAQAELDKAKEAEDRIKAREESDKLNLDWNKKK